MINPFPRLTRPQMARLVEIGTADRHAWAWDKPSSTKKLKDLGLVETYGVHSDGRRVVTAVCPTLTGMAILAGLPGERFEWFRVMLNKDSFAPN